MDRKTWNRVGLAAIILLAPGGFVLGAGLAARRFRKREAEKNDAAEADSQAVSEPPREAAPKPPGRSARG